TDNSLCQFRSLILLEEMTSANQGGMGLPLCPWNSLLEETITAPRNGIRVAEHRQERLLPAAQDLPGFAVGDGGGIIRRSRDQEWELPRPRLICLIRERRIIGSYHCGGKFGDTGTFDDATSMKNRCLL